MGGSQKIRQLLVESPDNHMGTDGANLPKDVGNDKISAGPNTVTACQPREPRTMMHRAHTRRSAGKVEAWMCQHRRCRLKTNFQQGETQEGTGTKTLQIRSLLHDI